jgi:hypothetical protein
LKSNPLQRNALDKVLRERLAAKRAEQLERMRAIPDDQAQAARA